MAQLAVDAFRDMLRPGGISRSTADALGNTRSLPRIFGFAWVKWSLSSNV
jgi:hypothetical protein